MFEEEGQGALPAGPKLGRSREGELRKTREGVLRTSAPDPHFYAVPNTEAHDPRTHALDQWPTETAIQALWEGQLAAVAAVRPALPAIAAAAEQAATRLHTAGRLIYCGAGTSGRLGVLDASELNPTFDWPPERLHYLIAGGRQAITRSVENAEDDTQQAAMDVADAGIGSGDVFIALAASGATPYTLACARLARARGALTIGVANSPAAALLAACEHAILVETGAEPIAGSTRMKAGTAQKVVLTLLSSAIMLRLGRVWRGRMVDMAARNEKLRRRAVRMVRDLTGAGEDEAGAALASAGGKVKLAILLLHGMDAETAAAELEKHGGRLGEIIGP
jgi:N-acetylmuramic acid 6-phosphate etherase